MLWCTCSRRARLGATCLNASAHGKASTTASQTGVQGRPLEADLQGAAAEGGTAVETWPMRRSCGHTRIRREQKGACSQLLGSFTWWILDEGPRPFGTPRAAPIHVELTAGQTHEATVAAALLEHADGRAFIGDTGYDAERIRAAAAARGMRVVIPSHPTRATEHRLDKKLYRIRYRIECLFHRLKRCRRLATRYEKTRSQLPCVRPSGACALIWISMP